MQFQAYYFNRTIVELKFCKGCKTASAAVILIEP